MLSGAQKAEREALFIEELASLIEWEYVPGFPGCTSDFTSDFASGAVRTASVPFFQRLRNRVRKDKKVFNRNESSFGHDFVLKRSGRKNKRRAFRFLHIGR